MKIYKYKYNLTNGKTRVIEYDCRQVAGGYVIAGKGQFISEKRFKEFKPVKNKGYLMAWGFQNDKELEFKENCKDKIKKLLYQIKTSYLEMIAQLENVIRKEI